MYARRTIEAAQNSDNASHINKAVLRTFQHSLTSFADAISAILLDATATSASLDRLHERLTTVHTLCLQETFENALALDDLLWQLWTILGGNRLKIRDLKRRESVLKQVEQYRSIAAAYVAGAMRTMTAIDAELSMLRERLVSSALEANPLPIEVQLASIDRILHRLMEDHRRGRQLTVEGEVRVDVARQDL